MTKELSSRIEVLSAISLHSGSTALQYVWVDVMMSFSGVTFVFLCFVFVFMLLLKPRPFVQSSFDMQDAAAELGRNPVSKHQIQPEYGDEQADDAVRRDCRRNPSRETKFSGANERGHGNIHVSCSADHVQDWQPYPVDPYSCYMMCDHTRRRPDSRTCFFLFSFCLFGDVVFSAYFLYHLRFLFVWREYVVRSFLPDGVFFYLVTTGWILDISSCAREFNSINSIQSVESISRTVTCTGELSALIRVIPRGKRLNTPRLDCHTW